MFSVLEWSIKLNDETLNYRLSSQCVLVYLLQWSVTTSYPRVVSAALIYVPVVGWQQSKPKKLPWHRSPVGSVILSHYRPLRIITRVRGRYPRSISNSVTCYVQSSLLMWPPGFLKPPQNVLSVIVLNVVGAEGVEQWYGRKFGWARFGG